MPADSAPLPCSVPQLPARVTLRNGQQILLRQIRADDKAGVLDAFQLLSDDSRYTRFMAMVKDLPEALLDHVVHPQPGRECTLVAVANPDQTGELVGGASYTAIAGRDACEFAVTLLDGWHAQGLARVLMQTLIEAARAAGFHLMEGYVLASNTAMRGLAHRLGFTDTICADDATLRVVTLELNPARTAVAGRSA